MVSRGQFVLLCIRSELARAGLSPQEPSPSTGSCRGSGSVPVGGNITDPLHAIGAGIVLTRGVPISKRQNLTEITGWDHDNRLSGTGKINIFWTIWWKKRGGQDIKFLHLWEQSCSSDSCQIFKRSCSFCFFSNGRCGVKALVFARTARPCHHRYVGLSPSPLLGTYTTHTRQKCSTNYECGIFRPP